MASKDFAYCAHFIDYFYGVFFNFWMGKYYVKILQNIYCILQKVSHARLEGLDGE